VCHFDLPVAVLARQPVLRDCLLEVGPVPAVLDQLDRLLAADHVSLRNPTLLEAVTALHEGGRTDRARELATRIAEREPDWLPARQAVVALESAPTP